MSMRFIMSRLCRVLSIAVAASAPAAVWAFPTRTIEWVVPYPAGGGTDVVARAVAEQMTKTLGKPIVVLNKPGAATNIGAETVARAAANGHTLLTADTATLAANPSLYSKLAYDAEKDLAPVGLIARFPLLLVVGASVPVSNLKEFLAWAKSQPGGVNFASPGAGSPHHLATELLREAVGLKLTHVPYRGAAPAVQDVMGGQVPFMFVDTAAGGQHLRGGKLRAIGVASAKRITEFGSIPTLEEQGLKGFEAYAWQGLVVPAKTPAPVVDALNKALVAAVASAPVQERFKMLGLEATAGSPRQMADYAKAEREKWSKVIRAAGIKLD
jgi:tripartite-type tricarboxylate transporter receptor subunit TctC